MSTPAIMRPFARCSDTELLTALRTGDDAAFAALCARHEPALRRYAAHILRARPAIVDDVVQESLLRAHRALRRDERHLEVRPYLYRLVRNCCLDELARVRTDSVPLHLLQPHDEPSGGDSPEVAFEARDRFDTTLTDLAQLPEAQRHALVRRELDGLSHEQVAAELGITPGASKSLVYRARETLTRAQTARDAHCQDVRFALLRAHDAKRRAPMNALRHVAGCSDCRAQLKGGRRALGAGRARDVAGAAARARHHARVPDGDARRRARPGPGLHALARLRRADGGRREHVGADRLRGRRLGAGDRGRDPLPRAGRPRLGPRGAGRGPWRAGRPRLPAARGAQRDTRRASLRDGHLARAARGPRRPPRMAARADRREPPGVDPSDGGVSGVRPLRGQRLQLRDRLLDGRRRGHRGAHLARAAARRGVVQEGLDGRP
jgi:RNA polymerase sigma factor (sigma-70 family)